MECQVSLVHVFAGHDGFRYSYRLAVGVERKKEREKERKEKKRDRFYLFLNQNFFYLKFYLLWELWWLYGEVISITLEIRCQGQLLLLVHNNRKIFTTAKHLFRISSPISMTFSFPNWENFLNSVPKVLDPSYLLKKLLSKGVYTTEHNFLHNVYIRDVKRRAKPNPNPLLGKLELDWGWLRFFMRWGCSPRFCFTIYAYKLHYNIAHRAANYVFFYKLFNKLLWRISFNFLTNFLGFEDQEDESWQRISRRKRQAWQHIST